MVILCVWDRIKHCQEVEIIILWGGMAGLWLRHYVTPLRDTLKEFTSKITRQSERKRATDTLYTPVINVRGIIHSLIANVKVSGVNI